MNEYQNNGPLPLNSQQGHNYPQDGKHPKGVQNNTAYRIAIEAVTDENPLAVSPFIIPPFGWRPVKREYGGYNWDTWERHGLISVDCHQEPQKPNEPSSQKQLLGSRQPSATKLVHFLYLILVPLIGAALPTILVIIAILQIDTRIGLFTSTVLTVLIIFTTIAAIFPAALYFLFQRQRAAILRENFIRDIMRLCPIVWTKDDAEMLYGPVIDEVYGCNITGQISLSTYIPLWLSTFLFSFGWSIVLLPTIGHITQMNDSIAQTALHNVIIPNFTPVGFGFLGSYFFALNFIFRRYVRADLGPKAYSHLAVRVIGTIILVWLIGTLHFSPLSDPPTYLLALAFIVGIIPETAMAMLQDFLQNQKWLSKFIPSLGENLPLSRLDGITLYDHARLLEEGIDNIENLAHHNLIDLMLQTRIPTPRLVDLVDQAILYLHVRDEDEDPVDPTDAPCSIKRLRGYGIRTATDLERAYKVAKSRDNSCSQAFLSLLDNDKSQEDVQRLRVIMDALADDEWLLYLHHWRNSIPASSKLHRLRDFYSLENCTFHPSPVTFGQENSSE